MTVGRLSFPPQLLLLVWLLGQIRQGDARGKPPRFPKWPPSYRVWGEFIMEPVVSPKIVSNLSIFYSKKRGIFTSWNNDEMTVQQNIFLRHTYYTLPSPRGRVCLIDPLNDGPVLASSLFHRGGGAALMYGLPRGANYKFRGTGPCRTHRGQTCNNFWKVTRFGRRYRQNIFHFSSTLDGIPDTYEYLGNEYLGYGHGFYKYHKYVPKYHSPGIFKPSPECRPDNATLTSLQPGDIRMNGTGLGKFVATANAITGTFHSQLHDDFLDFAHRYRSGPSGECGTEGDPGTEGLGCEEAPGGAYRTPEQAQRAFLEFANSTHARDERGAGPEEEEEEGEEGKGEGTPKDFGPFSDFTKEQIRPWNHGVRTQIPTPDGLGVFRRDPSIPLPASVDWRKKGAVTPVKQQGPCGSCWAFSATGALEGAYAIQTGHQKIFSEQFLIDCDWNSGCEGCLGGYQFSAFKYAHSKGGIATRKGYGGYKSVDQVCKTNVTLWGNVTGYLRVARGDEEALKEAVATRGPVAASIDASLQSFVYYTKGVYRDPACRSDPDNLEHGVLVVGYGTEAGQDYWLVKNCWSTFWGDNGYVKIARNANNKCGIATQGIFPVLGEELPPASAADPHGRGP